MDKKNTRCGLLFFFLPRGLYIPCLPESWKWKITLNEGNIILEGPIFPFHDCGRRSTIYHSKLYIYFFLHIYELRVPLTQMGSFTPRVTVLVCPKLSTHREYHPVLPSADGVPSSEVTVEEKNPGSCTCEGRQLVYVPLFTAGVL